METKTTRDSFLFEISHWISEIIDLYNETNERTEQLYSDLYEGLPEIEESINFNTRETRILLDYFIKTDVGRG